MDSNTLGTRFTRNFDFGFEVREAGACVVCACGGRAPAMQ